MSYKIHLISLVVFILYSACSSSPHRPYLTQALEVEKYLQTAMLEEPAGLAWKVMPDSLNSGSDVSLYSGSPGVVLFYLELYHSTGDEAYLQTAEKGADFLLGSIPDTIASVNTVGLYTGLAGIGYTLGEVSKTSSSPKYRDGVRQVLELFRGQAQRNEDGINWGPITDIVYGASGIGLFQLYAVEDLELKVDGQEVAQIADWLITQATVEADGLRWKMQPGMNIHMDNFSHGTAGVAYFLARTYELTKDYRYLDAALNAGRWLASHTNDDGFVSHHLPGGEDLYYQSWCHGPAGTSRLYYLLYQLTDEDEWMQLIEKGAEGTMALKLDQNQTTGYWNNVSKCCGDAGVAEHYLWLYELTGNQQYLDYAKTMTQKLMKLSTKGTFGRKWVQAENRRSPEQVAAQSGLMQGSAGMGLWLLQLDAFESGKKPHVQLPDKPKLQ